MKHEVEIIPYPSFEDVFVKETNRLAKFVFLPLASIKIKNDETIGNRTLHLISIWDTGDYKKEYFGSYRTDVNEISFEIVGEKLNYKDPIQFPCIENLEKAYNIILEDFETQKDNYLNDLSYDTQSSKMERGGKLILEQIPNFGNFEAKFYFERITSALLSNYRFQKYGVVNSLFNDNSVYAHQISEGKYSSQNLKDFDFNQIGKVNLIDNLLLKPDFIQSDETPENSVFIGQVYEWHYISSSSTNTYLFLDLKNNKQIQIFQWD
jgi:hypothetical protein